MLLEALRDRLWLGVCLVITPLLGCGSSGGGDEHVQSVSSALSCSQVSLAASPAAPHTAPQSVGTSVTLTPSTTCPSGATPEYQYFYMLPAETNTYVQIGAAGSWTTTAPMVLSTSGFASGHYNFLVRARAQGDTTQVSAYSQDYYLGDICGNVVLAASPSTAQPVGSTVSLTPTPTCFGSATPEYHYQYKLSSESSYHDFQNGWSTASYAWNTTGFVPGSYNVEVLVKGVGNGSASEGYDLINYTLQAPTTCSGLAVSQSPLGSSSSPVVQGTAVTVSASASCTNGTTPEYQYFYMPPADTNSYVPFGSGWTTSGTASLSTTSLLSGKYDFYVQARAQGNAGTTIIGYSPPFFLGSVCSTGTALTMAPASSQPVGTGVTVSATTTCYGGGTPEYKFQYKLHSDSTYQLIRDWGISSAPWSTSGLPAGAYDVEVFVRSAGNHSASESYSLGSYTLTGLELAVGGTPQVAIYTTAAGATDPVVSKAATDLQIYLGRITGASFAVNPSNGSGPQYGSAGTPGILVGAYPRDFGTLPIAGDLPTPDSDADPRKEGYTVQVLGSQLLILGYGNPSGGACVGSTEPKHNDCPGVSHAVFSFLKELGCRWFLPGPDWEVIPSTTNLTFAGGPSKDHPSTVSRSLQATPFYDPIDASNYVGSASNLSVRYGNDWREHNLIAYNRTTAATQDVVDVFNNTALSISFSQGWSEIDAINAGNNSTLRALYPCNWFGGGTMSSNPCPINPTTSLLPPPNNRYGWLPDTHGNPTFDPTHPTLEVGNPAVLDAFWAAATNVTIPASRDAESFSVEPTDGTHMISQSPCDSPGLGGCAGHAPIGTGSTSDQMAYLANDMGRRLASSDLPNRYVTLLADSSHILPPTLTLDPEVFVGVESSFYKTQAVGQYLDFKSLINGWHAKGGQLAIFDNYAFRDRSEPWLPYSMVLSGSSRDYPNDSVALPLEFRSYGDAHVSSIGIEAVDTFGRNGLGFYMASQLMWNPYLDVGPLRQDFFLRAFPGSSAIMSQYFDLLDPHNQPMLFTGATMAKMIDLLQTAASQAQSPAEKTRITDLKSYVHHAALLWQVYQADHNSVDQQTKVKTLLTWDYAIRGTFMINFAWDLVLLDDAAAQFGPDNDWNSSYPQASWRTPLGSQNLDALLAADRNLFAPGCPPGSDCEPPQTPDCSGCESPPQTSWSADQLNDLVEVAFTPGQDLYQPTLDPAQPDRIVEIAFQQSVDVVFYPPGAATSVVVPVTMPANPDQETPTPTPRATVSDQDYLLQFANPGADTAPTGNITLPVPSSNSRHSLLATLVSYGYNDKSDLGASTHVSIALDKRYHSNGISIPAFADSTPSKGLYFYVPKGVQSFQYVITIPRNSSPSEPVAAPLPQYCIKGPRSVVTAACGSTLADPQTLTSHDYLQIVTVPVATSDRGKLWKLQVGESAPTITQLWFYQVPPFVSQSPAYIMIPRSLAQHDGLTAQ